MQDDSLKELDDAIFKLQRAKSDMEFYASDDSAVYFQNLYMKALDVYLNCLGKCHTEALPLYEAIRVNNNDDKFQVLENLTGHEFKRIP